MHDGTVAHGSTPAKEYFEGMGTGATSWGPIMGTGYDMEVTQFSRGEYPFANNTEDDLAIIAGKLGWRLDDHGDYLSMSTVLVLTSSGKTSIFNDSGIIGRNTDMDTFSFQASEGSATFTCVPYRSSTNTRGANVDLELRLLDSYGYVLAYDGSPGTLSASISFKLTLAGTYYLQVSSQGDTKTPYSVYGSMGQYFLSGSVPTLSVSSPQGSSLQLNAGAIVGIVFGKCELSTVEGFLY